MQNRKWQEVMPEKQSKPWRHEVMQRNRTLSHRHEDLKQRYITRKWYAQTALHVIMQEVIWSNHEKMVQEIQGKRQESWVIEAIEIESFKKKEVIQDVKSYP